MIYFALQISLLCLHRLLPPAATMIWEVSRLQMSTPVSNCMKRMQYGQLHQQGKGEVHYVAHGEIGLNEK